MLLQILIKNRRGQYHSFYEEEIELPKYEDMSFEDNVEMRELYVKRKARALEIKYQHYLEDKEYQFALIAPASNVAESLNQEESKLKIA